MEIEKYMRQPFVVDAVRVTAENFADVAKWCGGEVCVSRPRKTASGEAGQRTYVKVEVFRPFNDKQTMAFEGDWVLKAGTGFKVFTDKAFHKSFVKSPIRIVSEADQTRWFDGAQVHHNEEGVRSIAYGRAVVPFENGPAEDMTITPPGDVAKTFFDRDIVEGPYTVNRELLEPVGVDFQTTVLDQQWVSAREGLGFDRAPDDTPVFHDVIEDTLGNVPSIRSE